MKRQLKKLTSRPKSMPAWMECTWRRKPCERDDCPICGKIKQDRERRIFKGEDPDDLKLILEDVGNNLKEALSAIEKDAKLKGFEISNIKAIKTPPAPENFPLCSEVRLWRDEIHSFAEKSDAPFWTFTEDAEDLFWYSNTLLAKIYRQQCNRWEIQQGADYGDFDYAYTSYILSECLKILGHSLGRLIMVGANDRGKLMLLMAKVMIFEKKIADI